MDRYEEILDSVRQLSLEEQEHMRRDLAVLVDDAPPEIRVPQKTRTPGLNRGLIWISDDFNDPLPEEFLGLTS